MNFTERHHTDMHGIVVGDFVYEIDGCEANKNTPPDKRARYKVVRVGGYYKDDYIILSDFTNRIKQGIYDLRELPLLPPPPPPLPWYRKSFFDVLCSTILDSVIVSMFSCMQ